LKINGQAAAGIAASCDWLWLLLYGKMVVNTVNPSASYRMFGARLAVGVDLLPPIFTQYTWVESLLAIITLSIKMCYATTTTTTTTAAVDNEGASSSLIAKTVRSRRTPRGVAELP